MSSFCACGHTYSLHSKIDEREWCAGGSLLIPCRCVRYEFALNAETTNEYAARKAVAEFQRAKRRGARGWRWEPDDGDRAWSERKDASAKGRR